MAVEFLWREALNALALVPVLVVLYGWVQGRRAREQRRFANPQLLPLVVHTPPGWRRHLLAGCYLISFAALCLAAARPVQRMVTPREGIQAMLVMDVSGSMEATDIPPNRMEAAKSAAARFVSLVPAGGRIGLVTFNQSATLVVAPTEERDVVVEALQGLKPQGGTAIGDGIRVGLAAFGGTPDAMPPGLARLSAHEESSALPQVPQEQRREGVIVLLSDGDNVAGPDPMAMAARAANQGVRVHTVGVGVPGWTPGPEDPALGFGPFPGAYEVDEELLWAIAELTGGKRFLVRSEEELARVYMDLAKEVRLEVRPQEATGLLGALGGALALLGVALRRYLSPL
uniref:VWA domain-containing protein n=1 Tax=Thermus islandicus TaxID=540988 RepID=A0A831U7U2_9DEIN